MKKLIILLGIVIVLGAGYAYQGRKVGGDFRTTPSFITASSTAVTVTTTSNFILASSTPTKRLAATIQPISCTTAAQPNIFVRMNLGNPATANTGLMVVASSTLALGDYPNVPVVQGAVTAITAAGTCTVLVTEWRSQY